MQTKKITYDEVIQQITEICQLPTDKSGELARN